MKRYCLMLCERNEFKGSKEKKEINLENIINNAKNKWIEEHKEVLFGLVCNSLFMRGGEFEVESILNNMFNTREYKLDILLDTYIILKQASGKMVELYSKEWNTDFESKSTSEIYKKLSNFIYNLSKRKGGTKLIFDVSGVMQDKMKSVISEYGMGIQRLWFTSHKFRKLFKIIDSDLKYETNIFDLINEENMTINNVLNIDDKVIMEKIIGRHSAYYFLTIYEGENTDELLEELMQFQGEYGRCGIMSELNKRIFSQPFYNKEIVIHQIVNLLKSEINLYNSYYKKIVEKYIEKLKENYTVDEAIQVVERNIKDLDYVKYLKTKDAEIYEKLRQNCKMEKIDEKLQKKIIKINLLKYNEN